MKHLIRLLIGLQLIGVAVCHDMWLETRSFFVEETGREILVRNGNGTIYENSENAVTPDRIETLIALGPGNRPIELSSPAVEEPWMNMRLTPKVEGNYWIALATKPRMIRLSGADFTEYLEHDGIPDVLKEREEKGISDRDEIEQYSKYVKAYLQVGERISANYDVPLGLEIEIIPLVNPYSLAPGESLSIEVLFRGNPLEGLTLHAGYEGETKEPVQVTTGADGKARITISASGRWYIRGIHLVQVDEPDHSYESHWATMTFQVK